MLIFSLNISAYNLRRSSSSQNLRSSSGLLCCIKCCRGAKVAQQGLQVVLNGITCHWKTQGGSSTFKSHHRNLSRAQSSGMRRIWWKIPLMSPTTTGCSLKLTRTPSKEEPHFGQHRRYWFRVCPRYSWEQLNTRQFFALRVTRWWGMYHLIFRRIFWSDFSYHFHLNKCVHFWFVCLGRRLSVLRSRDITDSFGANFEGVKWDHPPESETLWLSWKNK